MIDYSETKRDITLDLTRKSGRKTEGWKLVFTVGCAFVGGSVWWKDGRLLGKISYFKKWPKSSGTRDCEGAVERTVSAWSLSSFGPKHLTWHVKSPAGQRHGVEDSLCGLSPSVMSGWSLGSRTQQLNYRPLNPVASVMPRILCHLAIVH